MKLSAGGGQNAGAPPTPRLCAPLFLCSYSLGLPLTATRST